MRAHSVIVPPWLFDSFRYTRQWLQRQCFAGEAACSFSELQKFLEKTTKFPVFCIVYIQFFHTGFFRKKRPSCHTHCEETCMPPFPKVNVVTSLCLERPSKTTIWQQHWSRGHVGISCDVTTCRRMAVFLKNPWKIFWFTDVQTQAWTNSLLHLPKPQSKRTFIFKAATHQRKKQPIYFFRLMDHCKRKLEQIPFCTCQNPNPNKLLSSQLLPTNKEATLQHLLCMWAKFEISSCVSCMVR